MANDRPVINAAKRRAANDRASTAKGAKERTRERERERETWRGREGQRVRQTAEERGRARESGERGERAGASQEKKGVTDSLLASEKPSRRIAKYKKGNHEKGSKKGEAISCYPAPRSWVNKTLVNSL